MEADHTRGYIRPGLPGSTEPMHGLGDLALFFGGSETSFTGKLLELIAKADRGNLDRLRVAFPVEVRAWEVWMHTSPTPTADELQAVLDSLDHYHDSDGADADV
jgi:hypothetical protein